MKLKEAVKYNMVLLIMLAGIGVLFAMNQQVLVIITGVIWLGLVVIGNYGILVKDDDIVKLVLKYNRQHANIFTEELRRMELNHRAIIAKRTYFEKQPESIQNAYNLIINKSENYFQSILRYMEQYDYIRKPRYDKAREIAQKSDELAKKLQELCEDCYTIEDAASDMDISIIDDLLTSLDEMQQV